MPKHVNYRSLTQSTQQAHSTPIIGRNTYNVVDLSSLYLFVKMLAIPTHSDHV